jgi:hypothetical protein
VTSLPWVVVRPSEEASPGSKPPDLQRWHELSLFSSSTRDVRRKRLDAASLRDIVRKIKAEVITRARDILMFSRVAVCHESVDLSLISAAAPYVRVGILATRDIGCKLLAKTPFKSIGSLFSQNEFQFKDPVSVVLRPHFYLLVCSPRCESTIGGSKHRPAPMRRDCRRIWVL